MSPYLSRINTHRIITENGIIDGIVKSQITTRQRFERVKCSTGWDGFHGRDESKNIESISVFTRFLVAISMKIFLKQMYSSQGNFFTSGPLSSSNTVIAIKKRFFCQRKFNLKFCLGRFFRQYTLRGICSERTRLDSDKLFLHLNLNRICSGENFSYFPAMTGLPVIRQKPVISGFATFSKFYFWVLTIYPECS